MLVDLVNIWSIFGHVLGDWAQDLPGGRDLLCHAAWTPPGYYYGMQSRQLLLTQKHEIEPFRRMDIGDLEYNQRQSKTKQL